MARDMKDASGGRETGHNSRQRIRLPNVPGAPVVRTTRASRLRTSKQVTCSLLDLDEHGVDTCKTISELTLKSETSMRLHSTNFRESVTSLNNKVVLPMLKAAYSPLDIFSPEPSVLSIAYRDDGPCLYLRQAIYPTTCSNNKDKPIAIKPDSIASLQELQKSPAVKSLAESPKEKKTIKPFVLPSQRKADKHTEYQTTKSFVDLPSQRKATSPETSRPAWRSSPIRRPIRERNTEKHTEYQTTKPFVDLPSQREATSPQTSRPAWRSSPIRRPVRERNAEKHTGHHTTKPSVDLPSQTKITSPQTSRPAWRASPIRRPVTTKTLDKDTEEHASKSKPIRMPKIAPNVRTTRAARLRIAMKAQGSEQPVEAGIEEKKVIQMQIKPTVSTTVRMKRLKPPMSDIEHSSTKCNSDVDPKQPIVRNTKASKLRMLKERSQESSRRDFAFGTTAPPKRPHDQASKATNAYKPIKREFAFGSTVDSRNLKAEISRQTTVKHRSQKMKSPEARATGASSLSIMREHDVPSYSAKDNKPDFAFETRAPQSHETEISQTKAPPQQNVMDFQQYSPQPTSISSRSSDEYDYFDDLDEEEIEQTFKQMDEELDSDFEKALDSRERKINQMQQDKDFYECLVNSAIKMKQEKIRQAWLDAMNQKFSCIILGIDVNE